MAYASKQGRARVNPTAPEAAGQCDRCGFLYSFRDLAWQMDWRGSSLQNLRVLVCPNCLDTPQEQLRAIIVPADPMPIINARVPDYANAETNYQTLTSVPLTDPNTGIPIPGTTTLVTQAGSAMTTQPIGAPVGLEPGAVMPLNQGVEYGVPVPVMSVTANGTSVITVTCSAAHGLQTNSQISAEGLADKRTNGFYSVTVTTGTAFTYEVNVPIPAGPLLTSTTNMITVLAGLPYGYDQIPQTGI